MVSVQEFMQNVREHASDNDHLQAADAFELLLNGEADADDTARSITMIYDADFKRYKGWTYGDCHNKANDFFLYQMCGAVSSFGSAEIQQRLIDLLVEIRKQPDSKTPGSSVTMHNGNEVYWRDVSGWYFALLNHGLDYNHRFAYGPDGKDYFLAQTLSLLNATRFAATLLERGEFAKGLPQQLVIFMQEATNTWNEKEWEDMERDHHQFLAPLAATWILIAGRTIYSHCRNDDVAVSDGGGRGWTAFSWTKELWAHWRERFQEFAAADDFSEECRSITSQAARKMAEIEAGDQNRYGIMQPRLQVLYISF